MQEIPRGSESKTEIDSPQTQIYEGREGSLQDVVTLQLASNDKYQSVPIAFKIGSAALQNLMLGLYLAANGKMLSMLSQEETGASSVVSTFQTIIMGAVGGSLLATGIEIGKPIGLGNFREAGHIAKASWILSITYGFLVSAAMFATPLILPHLYSDEATRIAVEYFKGYAAAGIPMMLSVSSPQIAFQAGEWYAPLAMGAIFYVPAAIIGYLLAFPVGWGALGVGLGGSIVGWVSTVAMQTWFLRKHYAEYQLYTFRADNLKDNLLALLKTGCKLSLQRLTEWGNLFAITVAIDSKALSATPPAIQYAVLCELGLQGVGQGTAMLILRNKGKIEAAVHANERSSALNWHKKNLHILVISIIAGLAPTASIAGIFYAKRQPLTEFLLSSGTGLDVKVMAEKFLWINMASLIPDSVRIIASGALRSWKDIIYPTFLSLIIMSVAGVPIDKVVSNKENNDWSYMFIVRCIAIFLAAFMMLLRCKKNMQFDKKEFLAKLSSGVEHENAPLLQERNLVTQGEQRPANLTLSYFFARLREQKPSAIVASQGEEAKPRASSSPR